MNWSWLNRRQRLLSAVLFCVAFLIRAAYSETCNINGIFPPVRRSNQTCLIHKEKGRASFLSCISYMLLKPFRYLLTMQDETELSAPKSVAVSFPLPFFLTRSYRSVWKSHPAKWQASLLSLPLSGARLPLAFADFRERRKKKRDGKKKPLAAIINLKSEYIHIYLSGKIARMNQKIKLNSRRAKPESHLLQAQKKASLQTAKPPWSELSACKKTSKQSTLQGWDCRVFFLIHHHTSLTIRGMAAIPHPPYRPLIPDGGRFLLSLLTALVNIAGGEHPDGESGERRRIPSRLKRALGRRPPPASPLMGGAWRGPWSANVSGARHARSHLRGLKKTGSEGVAAEWKPQPALYLAGKSALRARFGSVPARVELLEAPLWFHPSIDLAGLLHRLWRVYESVKRLHATLFEHASYRPEGFTVRVSGRSRRFAEMMHVSSMFCVFFLEVTSPSWKPYGIVNLSCEIKVNETACRKLKLPRRQLSMLI